MQNDTPDNANGTPEAPAVPPPAETAPPPVSRRNAWLGMGAVALALGMLTMIPEPGAYDPDAPPPAADPVGSHEEGGGVTVGADAPLNFTLKDINGADVNLASLKGKVIVINFWATWCGPCKVEIPYLIELQDQYEDELVILGVSVDDTPEKMKPYAEQMKINYPLLVGLGREDFQDTYGPLWGIPVSVFINRDGKIHKKHSGIATKEQFEREIRAAL
jgi:cytochrome c biogenesis protein CcmG/thiol:disulfide interchange protein DsbE